jgi:hypothetical protein
MKQVSKPGANAFEAAFGARLTGIAERGMLELTPAIATGESGAHRPPVSLSFGGHIAFT